MKQEINRNSETRLTAQPVHLFTDSYRQAAKLLKTVFPKKEQIPAFLLLLGTLMKTVRFTVFRDREKFVGLLYSIESKKYYFILYLAVNPLLQSNGCGGMILDYARSRAGGRNIVLNTEMPEPTAPNYEQRKRRIAFYRRHGISFTGYGFLSGGVSYAVLASDTESFDAAECEKLFGGISLHRE